MPIRLLMVEDTVERSTKVRSWCPSTVRLVVATSAGGAMAVLSRDPPGTYAGLLLDYDLRADVSAGNGLDVARAATRRLRTPVPVLVHTMSPAGAAAITRELEAAGFEVTRVPFESLTREAFEAWLAEVTDALSDE